jgi:signal transduction histidine kinase/class 3 adenylate cyclase
VVTFLNADLRGSFDLWERHPRAMPNILTRFQSIVQRTIDSCHGKVFQAVGDTTLAAFATARDGIGAAIATQRTLHDTTWSGGVPVKASITLHTATAQPQNGQYYGPPLVHLVRMADLAHGGQILLTRATAELVLTSMAAERIRETLPPGVSLLDLGEVRLRGMRRPERIFQLEVPGLPGEFPALRTPANRMHELARTVQELRALDEFSRVISATLDLQQLYVTIVEQATELTATDGWAFYESDAAGREFQVRAAYETPEELADALCRPLGVGQSSLLAQAAMLRRPVQIPDILDETAVPVDSDMARAGARVFGKRPSFKTRNKVRSELAHLDTRALLAVPLKREDSVLGVLVTRRRLPGRFDEETVDLVQAFASQSVLAIQNARLFQQVQEKSDQLEAASRHKSEFLASMSHELRTPLNAIIGFSEVLLERMFGDLNDKQEEYLQDILGSGKHLLALISEILDLAKVEAGRMELELSSFPLADAIEHGLRMVREQAARRGIALVLQIHDGVEDIEADERKVKQTLFNLLSNAVKFTPDGGCVEVTARRLDDAVEVAVRDTGIGIAPEDQEHIFDEFRQAGTSHQQGTGLGLTLAKKFVELHGGRIRVESALGEGSTFTITLPLTHSTPEGVLPTGSTSLTGAGLAPRAPA